MIRFLPEPLAVLRVALHQRHLIDDHRLEHLLAEQQRQLVELHVVDDLVGVLYGHRVVHDERQLVDVEQGGIERQNLRILLLFQKIEEVLRIVEDALLHILEKRPLLLGNEFQLLFPVIEILPAPAGSPPP
jgi:hypothetical protein